LQNKKRIGNAESIAYPYKKEELLATCSPYRLSISFPLSKKRGATALASNPSLNPAKTITPNRTEMQKMHLSAARMQSLP